MLFEKLYYLLFTLIVPPAFALPLCALDDWRAVQSNLKDATGYSTALASLLWSNSRFSRWF